MKICHMTSVHPRHDIRICEKECVSLVNAGYDVYLVVNDADDDELYKGIHIVSTKSFDSGRLWRIINAPKRVLKKALEIDAEVYHLHDPELLKVGLKLKKAGKKVIYDSHEFTAEQIRYKPYIPKIMRNVVSSCYRRYENSCLKSLDGMIQPCTYKGEDYWKSVNIPKVIIGNYPKTEHFYEINREDIDYGKVCYVGGLTEIRGLFHMIKACHIAGKKLLLIGPIEPELREKMLNMPDYECVEYLGVLPHDTAMKEASKCGIGLSLLEPVAQYANLDNLPTKVYEYMIMGMPVVLSDFPFWVKTLEKYRFGETVNPMDHKAVADVISWMSEDTTLARNMGNEGKRAVREEMNWELDAVKLAEFYRIIAMK